MKKLFFLLSLVSLFVLIAPLTVFAKQEVPFAIISLQADDFQPDKDYSITFSKEITIKAETLKGAKVIITVTPDEKLELEPTEYDEITVGATCKLIQPIVLELGENLVEVSVSKDGYEARNESYIIRRKDGLILQSLQNMLVIPGGR